MRLATFVTRPHPEFIKRDNAKWAKLIKEKAIVIEAAK